MATTSIRIPAETHQRLKSIAAERDQSLGETIDTLIDSFSRKTFYAELQAWHVANSQAEKEFSVRPELDVDGLDVHDLYQLDEQ